jgi:hypothetical protein
MSSKSKTRSKSRSNSREQKRQRQSSPKDLTDTLANKLRDMFHDLTIRVDRDQYDDIHKTNYHYIHGLACEDDKNCECFALRVYSEPEPYVHVDRIKYKYASKCALTGTDVLVRLTELFKKHQIPRVQLYDAATIHITVDGQPKEMKLSTYNILLHGESWYNRYGYRGYKYEADKVKNDKIRNTKIPPKLRNDFENTQMDKSTTFGEFAQTVDSMRRDKSTPAETMNAYLRDYLLVEDYLTKTKKIAYDFSDLKLR